MGDVLGMKCTISALSQLFPRLPDGEQKLKDWCKQVLSICEADISRSVLGTEHGLKFNIFSTFKQVQRVVL